MGKLEKTIVNLIYSKNLLDRALGREMMLGNPNFEELTSKILETYQLKGNCLRAKDLEGTDLQWVRNESKKCPWSQKTYAIIKLNKKRKFRIKKEFVIDEKIQEKEGMDKSRDISEVVENA